MSGTVHDFRRRDTQAPRVATDLEFARFLATYLPGEMTPADRNEIRLAEMRPRPAPRRDWVRAAAYAVIGLAGLFIVICMAAGAGVRL